MVKRKIVQIGNSAGVIIPKEVLEKAGWEVGDEVILQEEPEEGAFILRDKGDNAYGSRLTPEFKEWLDEISSKYEDVIKELANV